MKPFSILGYSFDDEVLCHTCLRTTAPITGEVVSHTCRRGAAPLPDKIRREILARSAAGERASAIATDLKLTPYRVNRLLAGEEDDAVRCPACEGEAGKARMCMPLYFADRTVRDERCTRCYRPLIEMAREAAEERERATTVARDVYRTKGRELLALRFDRAPPVGVLAELKRLGWRWAADAKVWFHRGAEVLIPKILGLEPRKAAVVARSPIVRKSSEAVRR
jgi:hypothetical protein